MATGERLCDYPVVMIDGLPVTMVDCRLNLPETEEEKADRELIEKLQERLRAARRDADMLGNIRATLKVNVERGILPKMKFDEKQSTMSMLVQVLEKLVNEREACKCGRATTV